jgi:hypothetical protein
MRINSFVSEKRQLPRPQGWRRQSNIGNSCRGAKRGDYREFGKMCALRESESFTEEVPLGCALRESESFTEEVPLARHNAIGAYIKKVASWIPVMTNSEVP